ncbi:MAG: cystathionine gamma-synthase family protein [Gammaproteobacteria bacterium]|nr:cystathionine gamma-synthase family protein [Gammaproteobacteria bacterium]
MPGFTTQIIHSDRQEPIEHGSLHKPIHANVAFGFDDVQDLVDVFQAKQKGYAYSRQVNPTVTALESKITKMERGIDTVCFATGMAAIGSALFALLRKGDHVVSSSFLFGNTDSLFKSFSTIGIDLTFVDATDVSNVESAIQENTRLVFVETIANPRTQVSDLDQIGKLCAARGLVYVVDNTMTSPFLYQPIDSNASLVVNSLTKYISGHGHALGGAITETGNFDWVGFPNIYDEYKKDNSNRWGLTQIRKKGLRDFGATLTPEAAFHIATGSETLALRMQRQCTTAQRLADFLHAHPRVVRVYYPGLSDHPEHERAKLRFSKPGALLSFELVDEIDPFQLLNRLKLVISSTNLGDNRTLAIPVAHTIYHEMGAERRASMGIADSLIRVSVGIEDCDDLIEDFDVALKT